MAWLGGITCKCGWSPDQANDEDALRICEKCGMKYIKKSFGWCEE